MSMNHSWVCKECCTQEVLTLGRVIANKERKEPCEWCGYWGIADDMSACRNTCLAEEKGERYQLARIRREKCDRERAAALEMGRANKEKMHCSCCSSVVTDGAQYLYIVAGAEGADICMCRTCIIVAAMALDEVDLYDNLTGSGKRMAN